MEKYKLKFIKNITLILLCMTTILITACDNTNFRYLISDSAIETIKGSEAVTTDTANGNAASTTAKATNPNTAKDTTTTAKGQTTQKPTTTYPPVTTNLNETVYNLSPAQKTAYIQILNGLNNFKSPIPITCDITLSEFEPVFIAIKGNEFKYPQMSNSITTYYDENSKKVSSVKIDYLCNAAQTQALNAELEARVSQILGGITSDMNEFDKIKYIHDTIIKNCTYDENATNAYSAYGALVEGRAVCEGYSKAMAMLCNRIGIECVIVTGKGGNQEHMWNMLKYNGNWYHMDVTWDDPVGVSDEDYVGYAFFNLTTAQIKVDHSIDYDAPYSVPVATATEGNYYIYTKTFARSYVEAADIIKNEAIRINASKGTLITIKVDSSVYDSVYNKLFNERDTNGYTNISSIFYAVNTKLSNKATPVSCFPKDSSCIISINLRY